MNCYFEFYYFKKDPLIRFFFNTYNVQTSTFTVYTILELWTATAHDELWNYLTNFYVFFKMCVYLRMTDRSQA